MEIPSHLFHLQQKRKKLSKIKTKIRMNYNHKDILHDLNICITKRSLLIQSKKLTLKSAALNYARYYIGCIIIYR